MIGDATRTPIVLEITKQVFKKPDTMRTLNSQECIAKGAALQSAMLSPLFSVSQFTVEEYNALPVIVKYKLHDSEK
jgi:heat shock protein 4